MEQTVALAKSGQSPAIVEDVTLISPGVWTGTDNHPTNYSSETILKGFENSDWENMNLFLDHQDTKARGVSNWAGFIRNPRMVGSELHGDLEVWHPMISMFIKEAKAKFGVSMTTEGIEKMLSGDLYDYDINRFVSFSIVDDPACKISWINKALSVSGDTKTIISSSIEMNSKELEQPTNIIESKKGVEKMEEKDQKEKAVEEEKEELDEEEKEVDKKLREAKLELKKKELKSIEKQLAEAGEEEKSEEAEKPEEEEPKAEESEDKPEEKPEEKSEEKPSEEAESEEKPEPEKESESEKELAEIKKELAALKEKDNSPDRKSLAVGGNASDAGDINSTNLGMIGFLRENANITY